MTIKKVRMQLIDKNNGSSVEDVDVMTRGECVTFSNGKTFEQMLQEGTLRGAKGDTGLQGVQGSQGVKGDTGLQGAKGETGLQGIQGSQGAKGDKGDKGEKGIDGGSVKVGDNIATASEVNLFFKVVL